jgi:hypothetical protein
MYTFFYEHCVNCSRFNTGRCHEATTRSNVNCDWWDQDQVVQRFLPLLTPQPHKTTLAYRQAPLLRVEKFQVLPVMAHRASATKRGGRSRPKLETGLHTGNVTVLCGSKSPSIETVRLSQHVGVPSHIPFFFLKSKTGGYKCQA